MMSESPEIKRNTTKYDHKSNSISKYDQVTQQIMMPKPTRVNDAQTADAEVFTTGSSQINIVWKLNTLQLSVHITDPITEWGMMQTALRYFV